MQWRIHCDPTSCALPNGAIDVALCYSYDGNHFNRTYHRPFIERNEPGDHGGGWSTRCGRSAGATRAHPEPWAAALA